MEVLDQFVYHLQLQGAHMFSREQYLVLINECAQLGIDPVIEIGGFGVGGGLCVMGVTSVFCGVLGKVKLKRPSTPDAMAASRKVFFRSPAFTAVSASHRKT